MNMKPVKEATPIYLFAVNVAAQVGCLLILIVGGGVLLGLLLDQLLGTRPLIHIFSLIGEYSAQPLGDLQIYTLSDETSPSITEGGQHT